MCDKALEGLALLAGGLVGAADYVAQDLRVLSIEGGRMRVVIRSQDDGIDDPDDDGTHVIKWLGTHEVGGVRGNLVLLDGEMVVSANPELVVKAMRPPMV